MNEAVNHQRTIFFKVPDPNVGEVEREYILHLPASFDSSNNVPVPMVIDYHWWGGSANSQISNTPWTSLADSEGEIHFQSCF